MTKSDFLPLKLINGYNFTNDHSSRSGGGGGAEGAMAPSPVKISDKKDGRRRWPHRFHVSRPSLSRPLDPLLDQYIDLKAIFFESKEDFTHER